MAKTEKYQIIVDSREQKPLFNKNIEVKKLDVGDYSIKGYETEFSIERKSLGDLFGTLGKGHKRFKAELTRALNYKYFAIVIEGSFADINNKNFDKSYLIKMKGFVVVKILLTLHLKYNINVFFANNRTEAKTLIKALMNSYINLNK